MTDPSPLRSTSASHPASTPHSGSNHHPSTVSICDQRRLHRPRGNRLLRRHHDWHEHSRPIDRQRRLAASRAVLRQANRCWAPSHARRATSGTTAPGAKDSAWYNAAPFSSSLQRRRQPTPLQISTRPRGPEACPTIWSTIYANHPVMKVRIFRTMLPSARCGQNIAYRAILSLSALARAEFAVR